jgi:putative transposase
MFKLFLLFFQCLFLPLSSLKKRLLSLVLFQQKQITCLKRSLCFRKKRIKIDPLSKRFICFLVSLFPKLKKHLAIVQPETVLKWTKSFMKNFWTFPHHSEAKGRPSTPQYIKDLILNMKNSNLVWGIKRIQGELLKLGISLDKTTISHILKSFRRHGKIKKSLTWPRFIKAHIDSLFATDFFTVDTIFNKRFYIFFIIQLKTRKIVNFSLTTNPTRLFVRQRIIHFSEDKTHKSYLIHDRSPEFNQNYHLYNIKGVTTSVEAPNMNAYAERFISSVRREALDNFIVLNEDQLRNILLQYIHYYNSMRPHQGIHQKIPDGYIPQPKGTVVAVPVLSGLHHHYKRVA